MINGNVLRGTDGSTIAQPPISISKRTHVCTGPVNVIQAGSFAGREQQHRGLSGRHRQDHVPQLEFNVGLRYEKAKGTFRAEHLFDRGRPDPRAYTRGLNQVSARRCSPIASA